MTSGYTRLLDKAPINCDTNEKNDVSNPTAKEALLYVLTLLNVSFVLEYSENNSK